MHVKPMGGCVTLARTSNTIALAGLYFSCTRKIHLVVRHTGLSLGTIASSCCRAHGYRVSFIVSAARIPAFASKTKSNYSHPPLRAFNCPRARPSHARAQNIALLFRKEPFESASKYRPLSDELLLFHSPSGKNFIEYSARE